MGQVAVAQSFPPGWFAAVAAYSACAMVVSSSCQVCAVCDFFMQRDCSGCASARVLRENEFVKATNISLGTRLLRLLDPKSC